MGLSPTSSSDMESHGPVAPSEDNGMWTTFLVEHYWPGVTEASFRDATDAVVASVARMALAGARIRFLHSTLVPTDEAAYCVVAAACRDLVRRAYSEAGVEPERVVEAIESVENLERTQPPSPLTDGATD